MGSGGESVIELSACVERWVLPCAGEPAGENLEYDPAYLELELAAAGRPETQFAPAEPPNWREVRQQAEALLERTRDLRVGLFWVRAVVSLEGVAALPPALRLLDAWLDGFWDTLYPLNDADDGDPFARISALGVIARNEGLLGDLRQSYLQPERRLGSVRVRDIEVALDRIAARDDDSRLTLGQISGMLGEDAAALATLRGSVDGALAQLATLQRTMSERFGAERTVDVKPLRDMLQAIASALPPDAEPAAAADDAASSEAVDDAAVAAAPVPRRRGDGALTIETRQDATRAINQICAFLERTEPTNPAQLFLRRAEQLINKNFLQLIHELAPDSMREVARIVGVDPDSMDLGA